MSDLHITTRLWLKFAVAVYLSLLLKVNLVNGEVQLYNSTKMQQVATFTNSVMAWIRPLSIGPNEVQITMRLMVKATYQNNIFLAGDTVVEGLNPNTWQNITIQPTSENYVHVLDVRLDGHQQVFNKVDKKMFASAYSFQEIIVLAKGAFQISGDPPPKDPTTTTKATTTSEVQLYNTTKMQPVATFTNPVMAWIRPLSIGPNEVQITMRLMVKATYQNNIFLAGDTVVEGLNPNTWQNITIQPTSENYVHVLDVRLDGHQQVFNKVDKKMFTSAYLFQEIIVLAKGAFQISLDPPPKDPTTTTKATTTKANTTKITAASATNTMVMTTSPTDHTDIVSDSEPWPQFLYVLGDVNTFPILLIVIISVAGFALIICLISVILCKLGCCSCDGRRVKESEDSNNNFEIQPIRIKHIDAYPHYSPMPSLPYDKSQIPADSFTGSFRDHVQVSQTYSRPYELGVHSRRPPESTSLLPIDQMPCQKPRTEYPKYVETFFT